MINKTKKQNFW